MNEHVESCDNIYCHKVFWGNENEYKQIGWEDQNTDGKKKTDCP